MAPLFVAGVFDGHGGGAMSKLASRNFLREFATHITSAADVRAPQRALTDTMLSLDAQMVGDEAMTCGTTAIVLAITGQGQLFVVRVCVPCACERACACACLCACVCECACACATGSERTLNEVREKATTVRNVSAFGMTCVLRCGDDDNRPT